MLGKIIADYIGLTEKLGENKNQKYKEIEKINVEVDETEWDKFQQEVKAADGDTIKIKAAIDDSELQQLKNLDGLYDYAVEQSKAGKDVDLGSVNNLITKQNYQNIADQAHGFTGVNTAIKEYKKLTDEASKSKFAETISGTNAKLGAYLTNLNGATAGMGGYIKSLVTSTLKSFALEAATMALNAAMSLGASLIISGIASGLTYLFTSTERLQERAEGFTASLDEMNEKFAKDKKTISELSKQYEQLSKGVDDAGKNVSLTSEEYEEYKNVVSQISDLMPDLNVLYDENGNKIKVMADNMKSLNEQYDEYRQNQAIRFLVEGNENGETVNDTIESINKNLRYGVTADAFEGSFAIAKEWASILIPFWDADSTKMYSSKTYVESLQEMLNMNKKQMIDYLEADSTLGVNPLEDLIGTEVGEIKDMDAIAFNAFKDKLKNTLTNEQNKLKNSYNSLLQILKAYAYSSDDYWKLNDEQRNKLDNFLTVLSENGFSNLDLTDENGYYNQEKIAGFISNLSKVVSSKNQSLANTLLSLKGSMTLNNLPSKGIGADGLYDLASVLGINVESLQEFLGIAQSNNSVANEIDNAFRWLYEYEQAVSKFERFAQMKGQKIGNIDKSDLINSSRLWDNFVSSINEDGTEMLTEFVFVTKDGQNIAPDKLQQYANELFSKAIADGTWDKDEILRLDSKGIEIDGVKIQNVLADVGETASDTYHDLQELGEQVTSDPVQYMDKLREKAEEMKTTVSLLMDSVLDKKFPDIFSLEDNQNNLTVLGKISKSIDDLQSAYGVLSNAVKEYQENNYLSMDTLQSVLSLGDNYLQYLFDEEGNIRLDTKSIKELTLARLQEMEAKAQQGIIDNLKNINNETDANAYLRDSLSLVADSYDKVTKAMIAQEIEALRLKGVSDETANKVLEEAFNQYNQVHTLFENARDGINKGFGLTGESEKDMSKSLKDAQKQVRDAKKKIKDLDDEEALAKLKYSIDTITNSLNLLEASLNRLGDELDLTFEGDFVSKLQIVGQQFLQTSRYGGDMRNELERLLAIEPQTADEAEELASRLESLSSSFFENEKKIIEYRNSLYTTLLDANSEGAKGIVSQAENAKGVFDNTIKLMERGSLAGDGFWSQTLLPSLSKDKVQKQRDENKKLVTEEQKYQDAIAAIRQKATDMAKAKADEERAIQRADAEEDLQNALDNLDQIENKIASITETTSSGIERVSDDLDTATQKAEAFVDAMSEISDNTTGITTSETADDSYSGSIIDLFKRAAQPFIAVFNRFISDLSTDESGGIWNSFKRVLGLATGGATTGTTIVNEGTGSLAGREGYIGKDNKLHWFKDEKNLMFNTDDVVQVISAPDMDNIIKHTGTKYFNEPIGDISSVTAFASGNTKVSFPNVQTSDVVTDDNNATIDTKQIARDINKSLDEVEKNVNFNKLKDSFYKNLSDKSFSKKLSKGIAGATENAIDNADGNFSKALQTLIIQNSAWDDIPNELQDKFEKLGATSDNWTQWVNDPNNALEAFNLLNGSGTSSWDLLDQNIVSLLESYGINGKEAWDKFVEENPMQALTLLVSSWNALETLIQQYIDDMISIVVNGANAIHSTQIESPGISQSSWDNLQILIANKIQEILNVINDTFGNNTVDLNFSINTKLNGNPQTNPQGSEEGNAVAATAKSYLGVPYVWGGTSPSGFDCSGLMQYAFLQNGVAIPRTSQEQAKAGTAIDKSNLQPGDMVFFSTKSANDHVGMYIGNGQFIHAPQTGDVVKISDLNSDWYTQHYSGARRVLNAYASGTSGAEAGEAILGDEGLQNGDLTHAYPELVFQKNTGKAFIAGLNGAETVKLDKGDTVLPYSKTKQFLSRNGSYNAYAKGTSNASRFLRKFNSNQEDENNLKTVTNNKAVQTWEVPKGLGKTHTYTPFTPDGYLGSRRGYWSKGSSAWQVYSQLQATGQLTTDENGIYTYKGARLIAMTNTFGKAGDVMRFTQDDGSVYYGIIMDEKSQSYAHEANPANIWGHLGGQDIVEFEVDSTKIAPQYKSMGVTPPYGNLNHYITLIENLGSMEGFNFSGLPTIASSFGLKLQEALSKLQTIMGTFKTNTHTVNSKVAQYKSLGGNRQSSYDFDAVFTTHADGTKKAHMAGENYKPEIMENKKTGERTIISSPTLFDPKEYDVYGEKDTAKLIYHANGTKDAKDKTEKTAEEYSEEKDNSKRESYFKQLLEHLDTGSLTDTIKNYSTKELEALVDLVKLLDQDTKVSVEFLEQNKEWATTLQSLDNWVEHDLEDVLNTFNDKYYEAYYKEQAAYKEWQASFQKEFAEYNKRSAQGNFLVPYEALLSKAAAKQTEVLVKQQKLVADSQREALKELKAKEEETLKLWQDAPTAELQKVALERLTEIRDQKSKIEDDHAQTMQDLTEQQVTQIGYNQEEFTGRRTYLDRDIEEAQRILDRTSDPAVKAQQREIIANRQQEKKRLAQEEMDKAHADAMNLRENATDIQKYLAEHYPIDELFDAQGNLLEGEFSRTLTLMIKNGDEDKVEDFKNYVKQLEAYGKMYQEGRSEFLNADQEEYNSLLDSANSKIELEIDNIDKLNKRLEIRNQKEQANISALQTQYALQKELRDDVLEYKSELLANKHLESYLDKQAKELLFNDADYADMISEIDAISAEATKKYKKYQQDIATLGDQDYYKEQKITALYNQEMDKLKERLAVKKQELELTKKNLEYENTKKERDTRVVLGGRFINIADPDKLYNIEMERSKSELQLGNLIQDNAENQQVRNLEKQNAITQELISSNNKYVDTLSGLNDDEKIRHAEQMSSMAELSATNRALSMDYITWMNVYEPGIREQIDGLSNAEWGIGYDMNTDYAAQREVWNQLLKDGVITKSHYDVMMAHAEKLHNVKKNSDENNSMYPYLFNYSNEIPQKAYGERGDKNIKKDLISSILGDKDIYSKEGISAVKDYLKAYLESHGGHLSYELTEFAKNWETGINRQLLNEGNINQQTSLWGGIKFGEADKGTLLQSSQKMRQFCEENGGLTEIEEKTLSITDYYGKLESEILNNQALTTEEINSKLDELNNNLLGALSTISRIKTSDTSVSKDTSTLPAIGSIAPAVAMMPHYASGTKSAKGGLAITDEDGYEAKLRELTGGKYTLLNEEDMIFNKAATDNLWDFANNPQNFLSEQLSKMNSQMLSQIQNISNNNDNSTNVHNTFSGDIVVSQTVENANELFSDAFRQASSRYDVTKNMKR